MKKLKTNFHFHTSGDPLDRIEYSLKEGIDHASRLNFNVLAVTCHNHFAWTSEYAEYAKNKGILLIAGVELNIGEKVKFGIKGEKKGKHVLVLNAGKDVKNLHTFSELEEYKKRNPDIFIIAPHPYFYGHFSLKNYLEKYIHLFDAIEHSWFYSKYFFNRNKKAIEIAKKYNLPLISTSDTHYFFNNHMDRNYVLIESEQNIVSIFKAIKSGKFENVTSPSKFFRDMILSQGLYWLNKYFTKKTEPS